ncbi:hypothetical protein MIND_01312900 [Mycena indigotica]|uniref:Uncharacterized protein n=1 Tax=Mycena indigotica TaxID=2126181 RepID=A0A8H6S1I5_9AGAR|nr:uncharacterized protein MIND_01312900 [Mycena indigotica]KAF7290722.1 hypothetical protein MIND_01312900 [Mycena indigotica]
MAPYAHTRLPTSDPYSNAALKADLHASELDGHAGVRLGLTALLAVLPALAVLALLNPVPGLLSAKGVAQAFLSLPLAAYLLTPAMSRVVRSWSSGPDDWRVLAVSLVLLWMRLALLAMVFFLDEREHVVKWIISIFAILEYACAAVSHVTLLPAADLAWLTKRREESAERQNEIMDRVAVAVGWTIPCTAVYCGVVALVKATHISMIRGALSGAETGAIAAVASAS